MEQQVEQEQTEAFKLFGQMVAALEKMSYGQLVELYEVTRQVPGRMDPLDLSSDLYYALQDKLEELEAARKAEGLPVHRQGPRWTLVRSLGAVQLWDGADGVEVREAESGKVLQVVSNDGDAARSQALVAEAWKLAQQKMVELAQQAV